MLYFRNSELAEKYHVSLGTVRNWITASRKGKLDLILHTRNDRYHVANTANNIAIIEQLVSNNKKFRPRKAFKVLAPHRDFYTLYTRAQIYDIVTNIELRREIPRQYNYFDGGATHWDEYIQNVDKEEAPSNLTMTRKLLAKNQEYIDDLTAHYKTVNIIDIGVGNALPVYDFLKHMLERGKLGRYIAIDISPQMLEIAEDNIKRWFGDNIKFERYLSDITKDHFSDILAGDYFSDESTQTLSLILFIGGTLQNLRNRDVPLQIINDSMGGNDILIHSQKLDTANTRHQFDFNAKPGQQTLPPIHSLVVRLLNIDPSLYDLEIGYDTRRRERFESIRLKVAVTFDFTFGDQHRYVDLAKGEALLLWRASQDTAIEIIKQLDRNDFSVLQASQTEDQEYLLTVSRIKSRPDIGC